MSNQRINFASNSTPDPYGNYTNNMVSLPISTKLKPKNIMPSLPENSNDNIMANYNSVANLKPLEQATYTNKIDSEVGAQATSNAFNSVGAFGNTYKNALNSGASKGMAAGGAAASGVGFLMNAAGSVIENKAQNTASHKGMIFGSGLKSAGTGASIGASIGSAFTPIGTVIGAGIGAVGGFVAGAVSGNKNKKALIKSETEERNAINKYNTDLKQKQGILRYKTADIAKSNQLANLPQVNRYAMGGSLSSNPQEEAAKQKQMIEAIGQMYQEGLSVKQISEKTKIKTEDIEKVLMFLQEQAKEKPPVYKRGGKIKPSNKLVQKCNCGCTKTKTKMFRRGGVLDLEKENVIVDGPSHDDHNNTGIKGDKGIPVVKDGKKVAEIESFEWVLNKTASEEIQGLREEAKKGNSAAIKKLGDLVAEELGKNTYDYTKTI